MALWANLPVALAPGTGSKIVFAKVMVVQMGLRLQTALAMVSECGCVFDSFADALAGEDCRRVSRGDQAGDVMLDRGLYRGLGLHNAGLILANPGSLVGFAKLTSAGPLLALVGMLFTAVLLVREVPGGFLTSIAALKVAGLFLKDVNGLSIT
jgi:AGZA family xanthine/uracil permease-like MFS transporter